MNNWEYETKCRRCDKLNKWHFSSKAETDWYDFVDNIKQRIKEPKSMYCEHCEKHTVQEVVSYTQNK